MKRMSQCFQKYSTLGTVLENLKTPFTCGRKAKTEEKSPFSKISGYISMGPESLLNALVRYVVGGRFLREGVMDICPAKSWLCPSKNRSDRTT